MSVFRFKQFAVDQAGCAMRINTDGVLLGAMATSASPKRILDVGTGTGVISLMVAQRFPMAAVDAIEVDELAASTARRNFEWSPFANRLTCFAVALEDFEPDAPYDLIVSNPPYFLDSLQNSDARKRLARHTDMNFFDQLLARSCRWLTPSGSLQVVLPTSMAERISAMAASNYGLTLQATATIRSFPAHPPVRQLLTLGKESETRVGHHAEFVIYERPGVYTRAYRRLLEAFFLAF